MRQWCLLTSAASTWAEVYVLPVPGGPCTARYESSRSSSALVMSATMSPVRGSGCPLRVRGSTRSNTSVTAHGASVGRRSATAAAAIAIDSCSGAVLIGGPGVNANGAAVNVSPFLGWRSTMTTSLGTSGSSHSRTATEAKPRRSGSSASPGGAGGSYSAYISRDSSPDAIPPTSFRCRCGRRALGGVCQSATTSWRSAMNTPLLSAHSSTGLLTRSKCAHQNGLSSRLWKPLAAAYIATAICSGLRASTPSPANLSSVRSTSSTGAGSAVSAPRAIVCGPRGGTPDSMARAISQSRSRRVERQS